MPAIAIFVPHRRYPISIRKGMDQRKGLLHRLVHLDIDGERFPFDGGELFLVPKELGIAELMQEIESLEMLSLN